MLTKTKIALVAALIVGTASAALAGDSSSDPGGGYVVPGSMDGVNPVHHPDIFGQAGKSSGYVTSPTQQDDLSQSRKSGHSR